MTDEREPIGSVGEEAIKLFEALQEWARDGKAGSTAAGTASAFRAANEHIATGAEECRYCPLCRLIAAAREVSPEVKEHLSAAGTSLLSAIVALSSEAKPPPRDPTSSASGFERIDLNDDEDWPDG